MTKTSKKAPVAAKSAAKPKPTATTSQAAKPTKAATDGKKQGKKTEKVKDTPDLQALYAALQQGDAKAVHEVRKLSRKLGAELSLADAPRKQRRIWRDIRRTAAPIRDHDITGEHIANAMTKLKVPATQVRKFQQDWEAARQQHLQDVKWPELPELSKTKKLKKKARESLPEQARHLQKSAAEILPTHDSARWHEWRKEMKRYRYTLEVLGAAPEIVKDTLDALGRLQDAEVVMDAVNGPDWKHGHAAALTKQEQAARTRARTRVRQLWPALEQHFQEMMATK